MIEVQARAEIPLPPHLYWKLRSSQEFFALESKIQNNTKEILEHTKLEDGTETQTIATTLDLSGIPSWLLGPVKDLKFIDNVEFIPDTPYSFNCTTKPNQFANSVNINSKTFLDIPEGVTDHCVQICTTTIDISMWGVGSYIEEIIKNGILEAYGKLGDLSLEFMELYPNYFDDEELAGTKYDRSSLVSEVDSDEAKSDSD
eukprot:Pgem_evm1s7142